MYGSTTTTGKIEYHVNILPEIFYSKSRARLSHAMALHNCKQGQEWINYNSIYKISLLNISKICMDLSVASSLHGNKITADRQRKYSLKSETLRGLVCMLVLVTTEITKIHGMHLWKDGMACNKTHVELMPIRCTDLKIQKMTNLQVLIRTRR